MTLSRPEPTLTGGDFQCRHCRLLFSFVRRLPLPRGDEGPTQVGGQALDKARGRKPRNEARPFNRGAALWAFERRPTAQVRDVHGAAPCAACCVKPLPALGGMGGVSAARHVMRRRVAGAAGFDQARPNGCWRKAAGVDAMPGHEVAPLSGGARIVAPRAKVSMTRITDPQQRHTKPAVGVVDSAAAGSTAMARGSSGGVATSSSRACARCCRRPALASNP